jgi:tripartite-type tricarboxylate transporter receptor subunit TctC
VLGNIDGGTLRALAIGTSKRLARYPDLPTFVELGFNISPIAWLEIAGPPGLSRELQTAMKEQITKILTRPSLKEALAQELIEPIEMSPEELTTMLKNEIARWTPILESIGMRK